MSQLVLRLDADSRIGWGHLSRCLAVAAAWRDAGGRATFVIRRDSHSTAPIDRIRLQGHACLPIGQDVRESDELTFLRLLSDSLNASWVVLDGYHFNSEYQRHIRPAVANLAVIDDLGHLPRYHADLLINPSPSAQTVSYVCDEQTTKLLGMKYLPLRQELARFRQRRAAPRQASRLLVTLGGGDSTEPLLKVVEAVAGLDRLRLELQLIPGPDSKRLAELKAALMVRADSHLRLVAAIDDLPARMAWADLAIAAAGTTAWELAYLGVPTIALTLADNQVPIASHLNGSGAALWLGDASKVAASQIAAAVTRLLDDAGARQAMSDVGFALVDGLGARRIVEAMRALELRIRPAQDDDCRMIWHWANETETRLASFQTEPIDWPSHQDWFRQKVAGDDALLLVAVNAQGEPIGQARFQRRDEAALASISVDRLLRQQGLGTRLIRKSVRAAFARWPRIQRIEAEIKSSNVASLRTFERAGFLRHSTIVRGGTEAVMFEIHRGQLP